MLVRQSVEKAIAETDLLITTGGVSVGDYDYLPAIYERLGAKVLFNKVAMRPGSVTTVAVLGDKLLFGLIGQSIRLFYRVRIVYKAGDSWNDGWNGALYAAHGSETWRRFHKAESVYAIHPRNLGDDGRRGRCGACGF